MLTVLAASANICCAQSVNVTTWHNDVARTGQNNQETILTTALVGNVKTFGRVCSAPLDAKAYAQPLVMTGVAFMGGLPKTVVYVETENDSIYAIDGTNCNVLKGPVSLLTNSAKGEVPANCHDIGGGGCQTIQPSVGILGTPVIDGVTNTLYVVAESECPAGSACSQNGTSVFWHRLHALDIRTLSTSPEKFGAPVQICPTGCGRDATGSAFSQNHIQRPGLLLLGAAPAAQSGDMVYAAFSMMDGAPAPHPSGWVFGFHSHDLGATPLAYPTTPQAGAEGGGIWQAGAGLAAGPDSTGQTFLYLATADGTFDLNTGGPDAGNSVVKLTTSLTPPPGANYFTPSDQCYRASEDLDFGTGGVVLLPQGALAAYPYLAVSTDKENYLWFMDRTHLGGFDPGQCTQVPGCPDDGVPMCPTSNWANHNVGAVNFTDDNQARATPIYWAGNNSIYLAGTYTPIMQYPLANCSGTPLNCTPGPQTKIAMGTSTTPSISSNYHGGTYANGIVWGIKNPTDPPKRMPSEDPAILYAFDATTLVALYNSSACPTMDQPGLATKFSTPTIANGYVYIATQTDFDIYGPISRTTCN